MDKLKLVKLVYLAERLHFEKRHHAMIYDDLYSLKNGPVPSSTLNGIDGIIDDELWAQYMSKHGNKRFAVHSFNRDELDEISKAEMVTLEAVWAERGHMSTGALVEFTHNECKEYTATTKPRIPIRIDALMLAVGETRDSSARVKAEDDAWRKAMGVLNS